jgi:predicted metal-dependent hydrolase
MLRCSLFPRDLADYVIVHELLHVSVPNHGKLWKSLMRAHLGNYEHLEVRLKKAAARPSLAA